ncbi:type II toxin-antitoxin system RelE/ParE family toxin [Xanthomonas sp. LF06-19]|uniref:type II toxin-antitoxin system RelE/ParE family toxin n=1 Tax=Xanthomonas sp. LF06-19 TaxID=3097551 RepID=UPI002A819712|nr:type II toxin-antitoxin system RelE/ParE family toxin [Xanthomonas sp. LF06-19]MDY4282058.1 type II toxin-antitoxin system RelE/ParE family toxin [Xanthomonas sp. LF06-19]
MRSAIPEGIARIFFTTVGSDMVLLHGIVKKSGKTPSADLATAKRRRDKVMR